MTFQLVTALLLTRGKAAAGGSEPPRGNPGGHPAVHGEVA